MENTKQFEDDVKEILEAVGGENNVSMATHCITRLRFILKDEGKVNELKLKNIGLVKGNFSANGQFQVIIGPGTVDRAYDYLLSITNIKGVSKSEAKDEAAKKLNPIQLAIKTLSDIFIPILPAIVTAGLLLGLNNILAGQGIFYANKSLIQVYPAWAGFAEMVNVIANTSFTFLTALVGWSAAKKFGGNPLLGIVLGLILVNPALLNAYSYGQAVAKHAVPTWSLFGHAFQKIGYQGQVLPVLVSTYIMVKIEKFMNKIVPDSFKLLLVAPIALLVTGLLSFIIIGPVTFAIGNAMSAGFVYLFKNYALFAGLLFGFTYAIIVITGMHNTFLVVDFQLLASPLHGALLWPMVALSNITQGSGALAMFFLSKDKKTKGLGATAGITAYLGVTEPAMYGVTLRYKWPYLACLISSACASAYIAVHGVLATSIGVGGLPAFLSIFPKFWSVYFIGMAIAFFSPLVLIPIMFFAIPKIRRDIKAVDEGKGSIKFNLDALTGRETKKELDTTQQEVSVVTDKKEINDIQNNDDLIEKNKGAIEKIYSPVKGKLVKLEDSNDETFASKMLGEGIAIEPIKGKIISPADGVISMIFRTKHALSLTTNKGVELLIHVGIDTVGMNGRGFDSLVKVGDTVKLGDELLNFDIDLIRKEAVSTTVFMVVANTDKFKEISIREEKENVDNDELMEVKFN
ncbi:PTS trehalose transporter subunit IIBC [Clostridium thermobutyricum]|uniref:PTS trehalose transporter subunit IIBC n=1 Tax=Clostridium thermobutyricum TaxID=29372 RepID=UPI0018AA1218|nr:PTS trehalose transporter subunit IIBC [Clostridium thermobutyricum]